MLDCIDLHLGTACTLNEWRFLFRTQFDLLHPFLSHTGRQSSDWCCPFNGRKQQIIKAGEGYTALSSDCKCSPCVEAHNIPLADLDIWKFCSVTLADQLCTGLGLHAAPKVLKGGAVRLGSLIYRSKRLPAYLLQHGTDGYHQHAQSVAAKHTRRCLFYTPRYCLDTAAWLEQSNHGYFPLEEFLYPGSLDPSPAYWQMLHEFKSSLPQVSQRIHPQVIIEPNFKRITFPDGYVLNLSRAHKRRAVVRFIHEQLARSGRDEFDVEIMREEYNKQHPEHPWNSDRFREDLFRNATDDFERLFDIVDVPLGRYRLQL